MQRVPEVWAGFDRRHLPDSDRHPVNATAVWLCVLALYGLSPGKIPAPVVRANQASEQTFSQTELYGSMDRFSNLIGLNDTHCLLLRSELYY